MSLSFGWTKGEARESHWPGDSAFGEIPEDVLERWREDSDASHLTPYIKPGENPTKITMRVLTHREVMRARALMARIYDGDHLSSMFDVMFYCFRVGVEFEGLPDKLPMPDGSTKARHVLEGGIRMLSDEFCGAMDRAFPGIIEHFGMAIYKANLLSNAEKKVSSPPATVTPSSEPAPAAGATESRE